MKNGCSVENNKVGQVRQGKEAPTFVPSWLGKTPSPQIAWFTFFFVFSRDLELTPFGQTLDSLGTHPECWWHGRGRLWALCPWCDCAQAPPGSFCKGTFTQNVLRMFKKQWGLEITKGRCWLVLCETELEKWDAHGPCKCNLRQKYQRLASSPVGTWDTPWTWIRSHAMQNTAPVNPSGGTGGSKLILLQIYSMVVTSAGMVGHRDHFEDEINLTTVFFCCLMDKLYLWGKFQASPFPLAVSSWAG